VGGVEEVLVVVAVLVVAIIDMLVNDEEISMCSWLLYVGWKLLGWT